MKRPVTYAAAFALLAFVLVATSCQPGAQPPPAPVLTPVPTPVPTPAPFPTPVPTLALSNSPAAAPTQEPGPTQKPGPTQEPVPTQEPAPTPKPTPAPKAEFKVGPLAVTPAPLVAGQEATAEIEVTNVGEVEGTYTAVLMLDGKALATLEFRVAPGANRTVSLSWPLAAAGEHTIELGGQTIAINVLMPAQFKVVSLAVTPAQVFEGDTATIEADVSTRALRQPDRAAHRKLRLASGINHGENFIDFVFRCFWWHH